MGGNLGMMGSAPSGASAPSAPGVMSSLRGGTPTMNTPPPMPGAGGGAAGGPGGMLSALSGGGLNMDYMNRPRTVPTGPLDPSINTFPGPSGSVTPGSGGQMTPTFGSLAPLAGMFMGNQPPPRAPSSGFNVSTAPIQQPMPNPSPAWQDLPTQPPLPTPAPAPDPAAARPQAPGNWAAQFMGQIGDTPYGAGNAMAKLQGWNQTNPQGVQRWIDAGHVPPLRGGSR